MDINTEHIDDLNAIIRMKITEEDYKEKVAEVLADYRKKAKFDGFRPGKAPLGLVKKVYGRAVIVDQVNNLLSENLTKHLTDNNIRVLGEPLPAEDSPSIDWDTQNEFDFAFSIGIAPEFELKLTKRDKVVWYNIDIDDSLINDQVENYTKRFGGFQATEVAEAEDMVKGDLVELNEDGTTKEEGVVAVDALVSINTLPDESIKNIFIGAKTGDVKVLDMETTFPNEADRASLLKLTKEDLADLGKQFSYTISEVSSFAPVEINQELFDMAFGEDEVKSEEEFRSKIKEELQSQLDRESYYKFHLDARDKLVQKTNLQLPDEFLKRWMLTTSKDEKLTVESLEEEYPRFSEDLKWQLIKDLISKEQEFKAFEDEIKAEAIQSARAQFQQYGIPNAPEEQLIRFSESILTNEDEQRRLIERILEDKVISFVKEAVKLDDKKISLDEFKELFK
ncbi:MAG: trigger factor [Bacteroidetes bacterium]|jgi:trigger factor|nr:trigger factor [Bacteroidota bacterium]MBT3751121.1 trigger factor [Bacteroidota bacterium]MBT4400018.1 trigger factor [Bacteroidota bacterium]MBT4408478.1 trigger factor [Bacteroidota bacterium]MBT5426809.1 trigger factor [Bacteroidota bacterium]